MKPRLILFLLFAPLLGAAPQYPRMGPDIYDIHADGGRLVADALARAKVEHRTVILDFGANWCIWCRRLHTTFETDPAVQAKLRSSFIVVMVDVNTHDGPWRNADLDRRYGNPTKHGIPVLVVLDADGRVLTTKDTGELEEGHHHSPAKILAFLGQFAR
jgi:thiol-disulfide isomerase/thioredoxin